MVVFPDPGMVGDSRGSRWQLLPRAGVLRAIAGVLLVGAVSGCVAPDPAGDTGSAGGQGGQGGGTDDPATAAEADPLSWGQMQEEMARRTFPAATASYRYGDGAHRFAELRLPNGDGPFPVAAVIHGGCWLSIADLTYMTAYAQALVDEGWAVWSLEFNRIDQPEGAWPGILTDVGRGMDALRSASGEHPLDLDRVVVMGHSSGGHLALWAAGRTGLPSDGETGIPLRGDATGGPLPVAGVVGLAPISDLPDYTQYTICGPSAVQDFLGQPDVAGERLALSDPAGLIPTGLPQLLLFGELDPIVPPAHGEAYASRLAEEWANAGADEASDEAALRVHSVPGAGHFELVAPWTEPWVDAEAVLSNWLQSVVAGG